MRVYVSLVHFILVGLVDGGFLCNYLLFRRDGFLLGLVLRVTTMCLRVGQGFTRGRLVLRVVGRGYRQASRCHRDGRYHRYSRNGPRYPSLEEGLPRRGRHVPAMGDDSLFSSVANSPHHGTYMGGVGHRRRSGRGDSCGSNVPYFGAGRGRARCSGGRREWQGRPSLYLFVYFFSFLVLSLTIRRVVSVRFTRFFLTSGRHRRVATRVAYDHRRGAISIPFRVRFMVRLRRTMGGKRGSLLGGRTRSRPCGGYTHSGRRVLYGVGSHGLFFLCPSRGVGPGLATSLFRCGPRRVVSRPHGSQRSGDDHGSHRRARRNVRLGRVLRVFKGRGYVGQGRRYNRSHRHRGVRCVIFYRTLCVSGDGFARRKGIRLPSISSRQMFRLGAPNILFPRTPIRRGSIHLSRARCNYGGLQGGRHISPSR